MQAALAEYYRDRPFVRVVAAPPRVKDVATSNYAHLHAVADGTSLAVMCVLDNLNKGAAGGGVQWMNRLLGFDETCGLTAPLRAGPDALWNEPMNPRIRPDLAANHLAQVFAQYPIEVAHGEGVWLHTRDGRKILDFYGGHAVAGLGYGHPRWVAALERQARQMSFQTNALPLAVRARAAGGW